jgi:hypothetical protein
MPLWKLRRDVVHKSEFIACLISNLSEVKVSASLSLCILNYLSFNSAFKSVSLSNKNGLISWFMPIYFNLVLCQPALALLFKTTHVLNLKKSVYTLTAYTIFDVLSIWFWHSLPRKPPRWEILVLLRVHDIYNNSVHITKHLSCIK